MSEQVIESGTARRICIKASDTEEEVYRKICNKESYERNDYYDSWEETLREEGYDKYIITDHGLFVVESCESQDGYDVFHATENEEGVINFVLSYYNGGCSHSEAFEYAINKLYD